MKKEFKKPLIDLTLIENDYILTISDPADIGILGKLIGVKEDDEELENSKYWF